MATDPETVGRIALAAVFVGAAAIGIPHRLRADRAGGPVPRAVDPPWFWRLMPLVGLPVTAVCFAFLANPRWTDFAALPLPAGVRFAGVPLAVAGLALFAWMFRHLGLNVTSTSAPRAAATLVTSGPYRRVRHPMYTATLVLVAAATCLTANAVVLLGGAGMFALMAARTRLEEARLIEKFGDAYRDYQRRTGRFLPFG